MPIVPDVSPEVPARPWRFVLGLLGRLPERTMSRAFGRVADLYLAPAWRRPVLGAFARSVGIEVGEAELALEEYASLNDFFVRRLRPGARHWQQDGHVLASPVDGIVGRSGPIASGIAIQAKGHTYAVAELLADGDEAGRFEGGTFLTLYLSPRHYHRIHTPAAGAISKAVYVPGSLLPVNAPAVKHLRGLFARNERLLCYLETARGRVAVVAVGAYNVGRISAAFDREWSGRGDAPWVTNLDPPATLERLYDPPRQVSTGDELMAFHLGSTVVLLLEPGATLRIDLVPGREIRVGEPLTE
jgi:phosphatidylserine decarboxylase